jgi:hypothetical protein
MKNISIFLMLFAFVTIPAAFSQQETPEIWAAAIFKDAQFTGAAKGFIAKFTPMGFDCYTPKKPKFAQGSSRFTYKVRCQYNEEGEPKDFGFIEEMEVHGRVAALPDSNVILEKIDYIHAF